MEGWIIKLYSNINCGLVPDIRGGNYFLLSVYEVIFADTVLRFGTKTAFLLDLKVLCRQ